MVRVFAADGRLERSLQGHRGEVTYVSFTTSPAGLLTASDDGSVRLWDSAGHLIAAEDEYSGTF